MKKITAFLITGLAVFYALSLFTACTTPPKPKTDTKPTLEVAQPTEEETPPEADKSPPVISVEISPQPYSPISPDGEEQFLSAVFNVKSASPIVGWHLELRESESDALFVALDQEGEVPELVTWDGRNLKGEMVESATVYNFSVTVTNTYDSATYKGVLTIDVLVQREEKGLLRIIVPSIIFAPNTANFAKGISPAQIANNDKILRRLADVLGYFETYNVKIEGHANPISAPNTRQRVIEQTRGLYRGDKGLKPLSEERAKAVLEYLVKLGVDRSRLSYIGMGADKIRAAFTDKANWWKNRRVEFILEKPEE